MHYQHLSIEERESLQAMWWQRRSVRAIARSLGRSPSSVCRELTRNFPPRHRVYSPRLAHTRALAKRSHRGRTVGLKNERVRSFVVAHLKRRWSPEQIAGRIEREIGDTISHEAIYQYVYAPIYAAADGRMPAGAEDLRPYLRRRRKRRIPKGTRRGHRIRAFPGLSIDARPSVVAARTRLGDWEGDTVESSGHRPGINTVVERLTGLLCMTKLTGKTSAATVAVLEQRFADLPAEAKHTLTLDNGAENQDWKGITDATGLRCYYAHPYHSWERGTNENTNGLIRDYFLKKTDFTVIPDAMITFVETELNNRPRKRLGWKTPAEAWGGALTC